jgi:hypothetical protein
MSVDGDAVSEPAAASTPTRPSKETFRIVTIEYSAGNNSGAKPTTNQPIHAAEPNSGDVHPAADLQIVRGSNSEGHSAAGKKGDDNSAGSDPQKSDAKFQSEAGSAKTNTAKKGEGKKSGKIPSMCPPPAKPTDKQAAEADAVPSSSYKAILDAKLNKLTPPAIPGIGPATAKLDCGSFL